MPWLGVWASAAWATPLLLLSVIVHSHGWGTSDDIKSLIFRINDALAAGPGTPLGARYPPGQQEARRRGGKDCWWTSLASLTTIRHRAQGIPPSPSPQWGPACRTLAGLGALRSYYSLINASCRCSVSWWPDSLSCESVLQGVLWFSLLLSPFLWLSKSLCKHPKKLSSCNTGEDAWWV